jgi:tRNA threonylcarbamoyladenosine biosynthesis protein TsaE
MGPGDLRRWEAFLADEGATAALGRRLGQVAAPGDVFALHGDLGAGKTCLARGFAAGLGVTHLRDVTSPTFAIWNIHSGGSLVLHHMDLYRLGDPDEASLLGLDDVLGGDGVCLVEWPTRAPGLFPPDAIHLRLSPSGSGRRVEIWGVGPRVDRQIGAASA